MTFHVYDSGKKVKPDYVPPPSKKPQLYTTTYANIMTDKAKLHNGTIMYLTDTQEVVLYDDGNIIKLHDIHNQKADRPQVAVPTNCKNCGAPLHGHKCEYCDTEYW